MYLVLREILFLKIYEKPWESICYLATQGFAEKCYCEELWKGLRKTLLIESFSSKVAGV